MSQLSEREPLLAKSVSQDDDINPQVPSVRSISAINSSLKFTDSKLHSPLTNGQHRAHEDKAPPWYTYATISVSYYTVAAAFATLLTGCTLGFPSSAVLDLTDAGLENEYKFDEKLSDIFGVSSVFQC